VVVLDDTPLGLFAEIEGDEASLRALARELGVSEDRFLSASYASLWEQARRLEPSLPFHMVFPEE
jgi:adenylate cyclase class 2